MSEDIQNMDEWEEVDPQEVEMVVASLNALMDKVKSENIAAALQIASDSIVEFAEWEEEDTDQAEAA